MIDGCCNNYCTRENKSNRRITIKDVIFPLFTPPHKSIKESVLLEGDMGTTDTFSKTGTTKSTFSKTTRPYLPHLTQKYVDVVDQERPTLKPAETNPLNILYWNGGGCMLSRLSVNPELKLLLSTEPDIFVYAESLLFSKPGSTLAQILQDYDCYHQVAVKNSCRRGLSVFYLKKHRFVLSKDLASKEYDIAWVKLENMEQTMIFCFFYAPGENKSASERLRFYDELREGYKKYSKKFDVFLLGDSNARLGSFSQDKSINGRYVSNNNKAYFLGFLDYTGLIYLNAIYAKGQPTYEIINRKKSIIDVALTNNLAIVQSFKILPNIMGVNPQTCHRVLQLSVQFLKNRGDTTETEQLGFTKFRFCNNNSLFKIRDLVSERIRDLVQLRPDDNSIYQYCVLKRMYEFAKTKFLGYVMKKSQKCLSSPKVNKLQLMVSFLTAQFKTESTDMNLMKLRRAHNELLMVWKVEKQKSFTKWLAKLNKLNYQRATRSFFSELKNRHKRPEIFGPIENSAGKISRSLVECLKNWSDFYSDLYKEADNSMLLDFSTLPQLKKIDQQQLNDLNKDISLEEVVHAAYTFKNYSSPGEDMILNRDLTCLFVPDEDDHIRFDILKFIHKLFCNFWERETVPNSFKQSIIRPFLKPGKNPCKRGNYRPISLLNVPMKLYEQIIKYRLLTYLETSCYFSKAQAAYRKNRSTSDHLMVLQELFLYYRYVKTGPRGGKGKQPLYLAFMDIRKAFDSVPRKRMFRKLELIGIRGKLLNVLKDIYTKNRARVRIGNKFSAYFEINSGVMQGSKLGPILFIFYIDDLLRELNDSNYGAEMGNLVISTLGFADDIVLITECPKKMQKLLNICFNWCTKNGMSFNIDKCKIMVLNKTSTGTGIEFKIGQNCLEIVKIYKYLGVVFSNTRLTSLYTQHFARVIEKAEKRVNCVRHFGFDSDGLRPVTCLSMYKILVRPILEYASQVLSYRHHYFTAPCRPRKIFKPLDFLLKLEQFQNRILKLIIPCPKATPCGLLRLLTGTLSVAAHIDILKLRYFWKLTHSVRNNFALDIYKYRRSHFLESNIGYVHEIFNLCCEYDMMWVWHGTISSKLNPLNEIKKHVVKYHLKKDLETTAGSKCVYAATCLTAKNYGKKYKLDNFLRQSGFFESTEHRRFFLYSFLDTGAYPRPCPKCGTEVIDILSHALTACPTATKLRLVLHLKLLLFNANRIASPSKFDCKITLYSLAMGNRLYRRCLCEFLVAFGC